MGQECPCETVGPGVVSAVPDTVTSIDLSHCQAPLGKYFHKVMEIKDFEA